MKVSDLDLDSQSINFLHSEGFTELYEPQEYSVDAGILNEKMDSLMRFGQSWIGEIGLVTVSYTHLTLPTILRV